jgi:hypothetical protein
VAPALLVAHAMSAPAYPRVWLGTNGSQLIVVVQPEAESHRQVHSFHATLAGAMHAAAALAGHPVFLALDSELQV